MNIIEKIKSLGIIYCVIFLVILLLPTIFSWFFYDYLVNISDGHNKVFNKVLPLLCGLLWVQMMIFVLVVIGFIASEIR